MGSTSSRPPRFLVDALQGLAFWIGHRHALFRGYPLAEGALVAEACNLIQANLPPDLVLQCECMYKNLVPSSEQNDQYYGQLRADLVLCTSGAKSTERGDNISSYVKFVIEVKRGSAPKTEIDVDLRKLHDFLKNSSDNARAYLIVVSEKAAHQRFVRDDGTSKRHSQKIPDCNGCYHVRRTVKAAASFKGIETANYVHLIEVLQDR